MEARRVSCEDSEPEGSPSAAARSEQDTETPVSTNATGTRLNWNTQAPAVTNNGWQTAASECSCSGSALGEACTPDAAPSHVGTGAAAGSVMATASVENSVHSLSESQISWKTRLKDLLERLLPWIPERMASFFYRQATRWLPTLAQRLRSAYAKSLEPMDAVVHLYRGIVPTFDHLPAEGRAPTHFLADLDRVEHISSRCAQWYRGAILSIGTASAQAVQATFLALTQGTAHDGVWGPTRITEMKNG